MERRCGSGLDCISPERACPPKTGPRPGGEGPREVTAAAVAAEAGMLSRRVGRRQLKGQNPCTLEEEEEEDQEGEEDNEELAEDWEQHMYQEERKKRASDAGESRDVRQDMDGGERDAPVGQAPVQPGHADAGAIQYKFGPAWAFRGGGGEQDAEEGAGGARKQCKLTDSEAEDSDAQDARASGPVGGLYQVVGGEGNEGGVQGREAQGHEADLARRPPSVVTQAPVPADPVITPRLGMALYLTSPSTAAVPTGTHSEGTPVSHAG